MSYKDREIKQIVSYVPDELYTRLVADAEAQKRSISAQVHLILENYYKSQDQEQD